MKIEPLTGLGQVKFGDDRDTVRKILNSEVRNFKRTSKSFLSDYFPKLDMFVYYDQNNKCEAIEIASPGKVEYKGTNLMKLNYSEALTALSMEDEEIEDDYDGFTSFKLGIGIYAPEKLEKRNPKIERVIIFMKGYYDGGRTI